MIDKNKLLDKKELDKIESRLLMICIISFAIGIIISMIKTGVIDEFTAYPESIVPYSLLVILASMFFGTFACSFLTQTIFTPMTLTKISNYISKGR